MLDLSLNIIVQIDPDAFWGLQKLEQLGLNGNMLTEITGDMWQGIETLRGLFLMGNYLEEVSEDMWKDLPELEEIWLSSNQINEVEPNGFTNLPNLRFLYGDNSVSFHLNLGENPLQCDSRMCWLRDAENLGSITLTMIPQCHYDDGDSNDHLTWSDLEC